MKNCPLCSSNLSTVEIGGRDRLACPKCDFVHWNNPRPVTATLIPINSGLVLVKRKFEPFVDWWCLPGGFIEQSEDPEESAVREVLEETGLHVKIEQLLAAKAPGHSINVVLLFYQSSLVGGTMQPGDDASAVEVFKHHELPENIAFDLHRKMILKWFEDNSRSYNVAGRNMS